MDELFGFSMTYIMFILLAFLALAISSLVYVGLRNRIMFKLGVRNIPRRRAQTTLIVLGLMLSTVIISAAFTTGDTINRSVTNEVYRLLGSVDQTIVAVALPVMIYGLSMQAKYLGLFDEDERLDADEDADAAREPRD